MTLQNFLWLILAQFWDHFGHLPRCLGVLLARLGAFSVLFIALARPPMPPPCPQWPSRGPTSQNIPELNRIESFSAELNCFLDHEIIQLFILILNGLFNSSMMIY